MSSVSVSDVVLAPYAQKLIKHKARQICQHVGCTACDREDIEQQLAVWLCQQAPKFDPARASLNTFVNRVVNSAVRIVLRNRRRLKRSTDEVVRSLDGTTPTSHEAVPPVLTADLDRRLGTETCSEIEQLEQREAMAVALDSMPADLADICRRLMEGSVASVAHDLGISRRQVRNALDRSRTYFEHAGFDG